MIQFIVRVYDGEGRLPIRMEVRPRHFENMERMKDHVVCAGGMLDEMEGTCGALVGAGLVLGMVNKDKVKSMKQMRQIMLKFQERNGATQCKLLKGIGTKVVLRECPLCVADAAEFLEEQLQQETV